MSSRTRAVKVALVGACRAVSRALTRRRTGEPGHRARSLAKGVSAIDDFPLVGREQLIDRILSTIHNNSILLRGEPGIGKTVVLLELGRRLAKIDDPAYEFYPVYMDLQGVPESRFFATLGDAIRDQLAPTSRGDRDGRRVAAAEFGHRDLALVLRRVLRALGDHCCKKVRLVLLVDGIDELDSYHQRTAQRLRGLFMTNLADNLVMVASAVAISKAWERECSPWYNFFEEIELDPLARGDAERMIMCRFKGVLEFEAGAVDRILTLTECKPILIRDHCRALADVLNERKRHIVTLADVDNVRILEDL